MSLEGYLQQLEPEERTLPREFGKMDSQEFQARIGPEVHRLAEYIEDVHRERRWWDLRVSEIGRLVGSFVGGIVTGGGSF